jgi:hypothetical protein
MVQREVLEIKNYVRWICKCGASNMEGVGNSKCRICHKLRFKHK